jgi:phosphoribosylformylglycinamidine synthase subunit PurSL
MLYCVALIPRSELSAVPREMSSPDAFLQRIKLYLLQYADATNETVAQNASEFVTRHLLEDRVLHAGLSGAAFSTINEACSNAEGTVNLLVSYRPAVTDSEAENAEVGYRTLVTAARNGCLDQQAPELPELIKVRTAELLTLGLPVSKALEYVRANLINELVQEVLLLDGDDSKLNAFIEHQFNFAQPATGNVKTVALRTADDTELARLSKEGLLALDLTEMQAIQAYFLTEERDPTDVELETLAQTWSEHCVHKTFKATVRFTELYHTGEVKQRQEIDGLFNIGIARPTKRLNKSWIVSAFTDNAGIIRFNDDWDVSFKVETHNHPSALEPFGGANTGLGGVIRDIMAVSAKPIASTDVFCFGVGDEENLPTDVLPPKRVFEGVVSGVRDYGNKMGIPTVNGAILFDKGYIANPLVFCGSVGLAPHGSHPRDPKAGDRIVLLGGRTGRDGIHGVTFSSIELGGETAPAGSVVQIGNPIVEKKTQDAILKARDAKLYTAITDCGGGGLSSAIGEMGKDLGVKVELDRVPLKYSGLEPWEIWVSEAQERMILAVPPQNLAALREICAIEEVEMSDLGEFTGDHLLTLFYEGRTVAELKMDFLHNGLPRRELEAVWKAPEPRPRYRRAHYEHHRPYQGFGMILQKLLADPNIASKEAVIRQYDHEVQGGTVIKPLVGVANDGPSDATVIRPFPNSPQGIVISNGINPRYGLLDPYHMAANAIDEAIRNAVAVGADVSHLAILDNFCWGNPNMPERLGELTRAVLACRDYALSFGVPFISGKDSLNNEYFDAARNARIAIPGTLLISAIGVIEDIARTVTMDLKHAGNLVYILGKTRPELGGSYYSKYHGQLEGDVPMVEAGSALRTYRALSKAIRLGLVEACHDLSEGGLAVAGAEMCIGGGLGMRLDMLRVPFFGQKSEQTNAAVMFSESPSRFLIEVHPDKTVDFEIAMRGTVYNRIGTVIEDDEFNIKGMNAATVLRQHVTDLKKAWQTTLF